MSPLSRSSLALALSLVVALPATSQIPEDRVPLQTALSELYRLREEYADAFNKKNAIALAGLYATDAVVIRSNGAVLIGYDDIKTAFAAEAPTYPHMVITSDTIRVYGNTAVDIGTVARHPAGGGEVRERYMVVLRRETGVWKITRVASVPIPR